MKEPNVLESKDRDYAGRTKVPASGFIFNYGLPRDCKRERPMYWCDMPFFANITAHSFTLRFLTVIELQVSRSGLHLSTR